MVYLDLRKDRVNHSKQVKLFGKNSWYSGIRVYRETVSLSIFREIPGRGGEVEGRKKMERREEDGYVRVEVDLFRFDLSPFPGIYIRKVLGSTISVSFVLGLLIL